MKIAQISIQNFRKLKNVRIELNDRETLFVGANNSGKTSAMDALRKFLVRKDGDKFILNDFTVSNRSPLDKIGETWIAADAVKPINHSDFVDITPMMDIWFDVKDNEYHYVSHIIPTLDWSGGLLGVRLCYLPNKIGNLFDDFRAAFEQARKTEASGSEKELSYKLFPKSLSDFLEKYLTRYFVIKAYILDPAKYLECQDTDFEIEDKNPLSDLIRIDMIDAQRGLSDADTNIDVVSLSNQFRAYYDKHLDIDKATAPEDLDTLNALDAATARFNETLKIKFMNVIDELERLGYPGLSDPKISIESKLKEKTAFDHDSAIQYDLTNDNSDIRLPEKYNGLGYQNLIAIVFRLISFRDARLHIGKAKTDEEAGAIVPIHLVLLEEPEAHLHVQVQQVIIKKAYDVLMNSEIIKEGGFSAQMIISTHSSHIAKEVEFGNIRYFKRTFACNVLNVPTAEVINLTDTFEPTSLTGDDKKEIELTKKFVQRYIKITHCDLFFADAVIFVEGTSENILIPYFIVKQFDDLDSRYISILPVGGAFSHKFKALIEKLGIPALVITDIDSASPDGRHSKKFPERNCGLITRNPSIAGWGIESTSFDNLLALKNEEKLVQDGSVMVAYQTPTNIMVNGETSEALASTFEDALTYANIDSMLASEEKFASFVSDGISINELCQNIYEHVHKGEKVSIAMGMMYAFENIKVPQYITEGLSWLRKILSIADSEQAGGVLDEQ